MPMVDGCQWSSEVLISVSRPLALWTRESKKADPGSPLCSFAQHENLGHQSWGGVPETPETGVLRNRNAAEA